MTLEILEIEQHTDEWHAARRGIITASAIGKLITPSTLKPADNDTSRALTRELAAERITGYTEPTYANYDMQRGTFDEPDARDVYRAHIAPVEECGFMIRDDWGFKIGYSPDGLVGDDGLIEIKSRRQKEQLATILSGQVPAYNMAQIQCGLLVSGRSWLDFVSYCGGMPLFTKRVYPDEGWQIAIVNAARTFETNVAQLVSEYARLADGLPPTERKNMFEEITV